MVIEFPQIQTAAPSRSSRQTTPPITFTEAKRRYEVQKQQLEDFFEQARRYRQAKMAGSGFQTDLKFEAMLPVLEGKLPVVIRADREGTIGEAIESAGKQKFRWILNHPDNAGRVAPGWKPRIIRVPLGPPQRWR